MPMADIDFKSAIPNDPYEDERKLYKQAISYLEKGNLKQFKKLRDKLKHYPLHPHLRYKELRKYLSKAKPKEVREFIAAHQDSPTSDWLLSAWLTELAKQKRWQTFLAFYEPSSNDTHQCHFHWAQLQINQDTKAYAGAKKRWLNGSSQPSACDPLFKAWKKSRYFKPEYHWQRAGLAIRKGNPSLAKYLKRFMKEEEKKAIDLWVKVRANPKLVYKPSRFKDSSYHREIIMYGIGRVAWSDLEKGLGLWNTYEDKFSFTKQEKAPTITYMAKLLAFDFHIESNYWLEQANKDHSDYDLHTRQIRFALRYQKWDFVIKLITLLSPEDQQKDEWQYWRARALQSIATKRAQAILRHQFFPTGPLSNITTYRDVLAIHHNFVFNLNNDVHLDELIPSLFDTLYIQRANKEVRNIFRELAKKRNFYGFLASRSLARPLALNYDIIRATKAEVAALIFTPGIQRTRELMLIGSELNAKREWVHTIKHLTAKERSIAAKLAEYWEWPFYAIITAAKSDNKNDIALRFPRMYHNTVIKNAQKNAIATEWVFSIIRQESAFKQDARSGVGALGLMQLMPTTAKHVSSRLGEKFKGDRKLLDPKHNIRLGTSYLKELYDRFDGNLLLATAAYNAGPSRAVSWRPQTGVIPADIWIETIPIPETRDYVKNVVAFQAIYQYQLGLEPELSGALRDVIAE